MEGLRGLPGGGALPTVTAPLSRRCRPGPAALSPAVLLSSLPSRSSSLCPNCPSPRSRRLKCCLLGEALLDIPGELTPAHHITLFVLFLSPRASRDSPTHGTPEVAQMLVAKIHLPRPARPRRCRSAALRTPTPPSQAASLG